MRFDYSDDQLEIQRTARDLLAKRSSWERVRAAAESGGGHDDALWSELVELGWPGIAVAEEDGGQGLGAVELSVLAEELGYACAATPFLGTVLAATAIATAGSGEQRAAWLPKLASGEVTGALGIVADGVAELVPDAVGAAVIVLADGEGGAVLVTPDDAAVEPVAAIDPTRRYARVTVSDGAGEALPGDASAALDRAAIAVAAELAGLGRRALEMSVAYVKERKQFGTAVGSFQAVQHRAALMLRDVEGARAAIANAAWAADAAPDRLAIVAAIAKAAASDAGKAATGDAIQLHGGIGFTWEANVHWLYKRAQMDAAFLGGGSAQRAKIAKLLAAQPAPA
jgi:alkylation response protein AidB-like acyl-CoA dehydrogenase